MAASTVRSLDSLSVFRASFNRAATVVRGGGNGGAAEAEEGAAQLRLRFLEPPAVARLYGPQGLLADDSAPGGTGPARALGYRGERLASSGGPVVSLSQLGPDYAGMAARAADRRANEEKGLASSSEAARGKASSSALSPPKEGALDEMEGDTLLRGTSEGGAMAHRRALGAAPSRLHRSPYGGAEHVAASPPTATGILHAAGTLREVGPLFEAQDPTIATPREPPARQIGRFVRTDADAVPLTYEVRSTL